MLFLLYSSWFPWLDYLECLFYVTSKSYRGRFPFNQNVWFEFSATSRSEWNSIFQNFQNRATSRGIPKFSKFFSQNFFFSTLLLENLEFSVKWFAFWKFNRFFLELGKGLFTLVCMWWTSQKKQEVGQRTPPFLPL